MFLRCKVRRKDGKQHRYWSVVENTRVAGGRVVQRHVLYLGEINDTQELAWRRSIEVLEDGAARAAPGGGSLCFRGGSRGGSPGGRRPVFPKRMHLREGGGKRPNGAAPPP